MKKIKQLPFYEQVMFYNILIFIFVSLIALIASNTSYTFETIAMVNKFMVSLLFKGHILKIISFIVIIFLLIAFIGYWITKSILNKYVVFGPYYLLLGIFTILFTESYHVIINKIDIYYVTLVFVTTVSLVSAAISFIKYFIKINEEVEVNGKEA